MAGIYIHIPFCKQACHYCNFHFSTSLGLKDEVLRMMLKEIGLRKDYLQGQSISSVYFGGGTPSLLSQTELLLIWEELSRWFDITADAEVTLEANPDDISIEKLKQWGPTPINRLSIGIQSFHDADLRYMNRAHSALDARNCIQWAQDAGFENMTIDLIYGTPTLSDEMWQYNMQRTFGLGIPHFSAYSLTVEPRTALSALIKKQQLPPVDDNKAARHLLMLMDGAAQNEYEHYEISNFARNEHYARHNSSYWQAAHYLGLGPSAHSYNGASRSWNIANNAKYIKALQQNTLPLETETLSVSERYNEYLLTSLRTKWGVDLTHIEQHFGFERRQRLIKETALLNGKILLKGNQLTLTNQGKLLADSIISDLFEI
ncbi:MAG: radical SAM family heme chaperone HemW [Chitinophagales bacterium]|nr:radical SAM family heme chaperone HemW [Chitinophagales bacterium]